MLEYFLTVFAVLVFSTLAIEGNSTVNSYIIAKKSYMKNIWLFCAALVLICVAGLRYYVGTDYGAYYHMIEHPFDNLSILIKTLDEPGFAVMGKLLSRYTSDGAVFIFVTAAFTMGAILYETYKYTDTYVFSSLLIIFIGVWHGSFNGVRQYFAAAIICLGHRFILDKKFWKYLLYVFIAFLFHKSAIVMIVLYFILRNKINIKNLLILTVGSIILLYNYEFIFSFVGTLKDETLDITDAYMTNQVNILRIIVNMVPAIFCLVLYNNSQKDKEQTFHLNILITYALLSVVGMNSPYLSRVNIYLAVLLPLSMGKLVIFKDKKMEILVKFIIIALYFVFWFYQVNKSPDLNNFRWIWQR